MVSAVPPHKLSSLRVWIVVALVWLGLRVSGLSHTLPISFLTIVPDADYLHAELTFNPFELTFASELDGNKNGQIDPHEWVEQETNVTARILECLKLEIAGRLITAEISGLTPDIESHHVTLRAHYRIDARGRQVRIESDLSRITSGSHLTQVTFGSEDRQQWARLDMQSKVATFEPANGLIVPTHPLLQAHAREARPFWILLGALAAVVLSTSGLQLIRRLITPRLNICPADSSKRTSGLDRS